MNISKKAARQLGEILAKQLHSYVNPDQRGSVIEAKERILYEIQSSEARMEFRRGYAQTLDKLEPLQTTTHAL